MFGNTGPFSYSQRAPVQQRNNMSRPSGKSIYMQRKEYSEVLNRHPDNFHVRVEHLFTCELDGQEMKTLDDCLAKLKRLDAKGRLWPQDMMLEVQRGYLLLTDIETKSELESLPLSSILKTKAVLDSCAYNSLLTVTVQERNKRVPQVFMFQCEETGAGLVKSDLDKALKRGGDDVEPRREQSDIRTNLENLIGQHVPGGPWQPGPRPVQRERTPPPPDHPPPQWRNREPEIIPPPPFYPPQEAPMPLPDLRELEISPEVAEQTDTMRNTDILNHVINDLEIFVGQVTAAANAASLPQEDKSKKRSGLKKKNSKKNAAVSLPRWEQFVSCLQKIKYGFNLLGQLDGSLNSPTAPDFVHIFFGILGMILPQYPADLPPTVLSPLLTESAVGLLSQVVDPEEDQLWRSLGDCWNIPRSRWPDDDVPLYIPELYDGWQPPPPSRVSSPPPHQNVPLSRSSSQRFTPGPQEPPHQNGPLSRSSSQRFSPGPQEPPHQNGPLSRSSSQRFTPGPQEPPLYMRVIYDFMARNNRELSVLKGDVVQVVQKSKQWWLVRNSRNEEGNIPQNVLESMENDGPADDLPRDTRGPVSLDMTSSPAEVKAWLVYKGFSKITVSSLGVLTGRLLLGLSKDEIRTVCPEEGGKVFFQLQAIKSAIALASEPSGPYNGRY